MRLMFEDREVLVTDIEHNDDFCDSYVVKAQYMDNGEELSEVELLQLTEENLDRLYEDWLDTQYAFGLTRAL